MKKNDVSVPLRTKLGVQLIKLEDITASKVKPFDQVRSQIENELRADASEKEYIELSERLSNLSYVNEDNLLAAADELDMSVQTTDWIMGAEPEGLASYPTVISAAFSDDVLNKGANSSLLEVAEGHAVVVRILEHEPSEIQSLEEVEGKVKATVKSIKAHDQLLAKATDAIEKLNKNASELDSVLTQNDAPLEKAGNLLRDDESVPSEIVEYAFTLSAESGFPVFDGIELDDGQCAIIKLNNVAMVSEENANVETAEWISVQGEYGRREMQAMLNALRETRDVVIFSENL